MWHCLLLLGLLAASVRAFAPAPIRWGRHRARRFVLAPREKLNKASAPILAASSPQELTICNPWDEMSSNEIPYFLAKSDKTIAWDATGLCIEASGVHSRDAIYVNWCTGGSGQLWDFLPYGRGRETLVRLRQTNKCLSVAPREGSLNGASIELSECKYNSTEVWEFFDPARIQARLPEHAPAIASSHAASDSPRIRHAMMCLIGLAVFLAMGFKTWQALSRFEEDAAPCESHDCPDIVKTVHNRSALKSLVMMEKEADFSTIFRQSPERMFQSTNVRVLDIPLPENNVWTRIVPKPDAGAFIAALTGSKNRVGTQGIDIILYFSDPSKGARELMVGSGLDPNQLESRSALEHLESLFTYFQFLSSSTPTKQANPTRTKCKVRMVSSCGSAGTKCPRWHTDKVPLRLVTSLVGPGSEFIPTELEDEAGLNRDVVDSLDESDTAIANNLIVRGTDRGHGVVRARQGQVVLMMGRSGEHHYQSREPMVLAAVHRSPVLGPLEGRVFLSVTAEELDA